MNNSNEDPRCYLSSSAGHWRVINQSMPICKDMLSAEQALAAARAMSLTPTHLWLGDVERMLPLDGGLIARIELMTTNERVGRAAQIQGELAKFGLTMEIDMARFSGSGDCIVDICTGDPLAAEPPAEYICSLAEEWTLLNGHATYDMPLTNAKKVQIDPSIGAAAAALGAHRSALGIEGDLATQMAHLMASLMVLSKYREEDFDAALNEAKMIYLDYPHA